MPNPSLFSARSAPTIVKTLRPSIRTPAILNTPAAAAIVSPVLIQIRHASKKPRIRLDSSIHKSSLADLNDAEERKRLEAQMRDNLMSTRIESDSIFSDELQEASKHDGDALAAAAQQEAQPAAAAEGPEQPRRRRRLIQGKPSVMGASLHPSHTRSAIDPDPRSRRRWERKMVIRTLQRTLDVKGKETREERIKRTEREALSRSPWLATSYKKLGMLARQISGKPLEEARTQMQFSKKKFAKEVLYELNLARDRAIVERGMGLGKLTGEYKPGETKKITVRDERHGKWVDIVDPTRMYVHEAWVNRGPWRGKKLSPRGKGRADIIEMPQASKFCIPSAVSLYLIQLISW